MAGCGYVCPICEGKGYLPDASVCTYCTNTSDNNFSTNNNDWIKIVHEGTCCADE